MSAQDIRVRIARLVVHDDVGLSAGAAAPDVAIAIGDAIRERLAGLPVHRDARGGLAKAVANDVLGHPLLAEHMTRAGR